MLEFVKVIRDPIHGYIPITEAELSLLKLPLLQRLRGIQQLSFVNLVYPDACHSRFSHALGVMHLAGAMAAHLKNITRDFYSGDPLDITEPDIQAIRLAGLLHDVGHGPFSHASEKVLGDFLPFLEGDKKGPDKTHRGLGEALILGSDITEILANAKIDPEFITKVVWGKTDPRLSP